MCLLFVAMAGLKLEWKRRKGQSSHLLTVLSLLEMSNRLTTAKGRHTYPLHLNYYREVWFGRIGVTTGENLGIISCLYSASISLG